MSLRDGLTLLLLAAIWGSSFILLRLLVPELSPVVVIALRVFIGSLCLLPLLLMYYRREIRWADWHHYLIVGISNSALPFCMLAFATVHLSAGYTALLNSSVPLWSAIIAALWLGDMLTRWQVFGVMLGFVGVMLLATGQGELAFSGPTLAILACALATLSYGISANYSKRYLPHTPPVVLATMSLIAASAAMLPLCFAYWPSAPVTAQAWFYVFLLGAVCTSFAYILFYRLIVRIGPTRTVSVTFLVPLFAMSWGYLLLAEPVTLPMAVGCAIILLGTAFTNRVLGPKPAATASLTEF